MPKYTIGLDVGSSSIKASLLDVDDIEIIADFTSPSDGEELPMTVLHKGWAQQDPNMWWEHVKRAVHGVLEKGLVKGDEVDAIGVSYQMHGMTPVDKDGKPLMDAIIWCDGRTAEIKKSIEDDPDLSRRMLEECLNLPGHFTASKAKWLKDNEPGLYAELDKILLPGHYILRRATGESTVTASGLSEGIFWNFKDMCLSELVMETFGLNPDHIPEIKSSFGEHGRLTKEAAEELGLKQGTPFTYFAGDQPNNAFSLNVLEPGEIAATAGTSAVVYGITDKLKFDIATRVNQFLHVNSTTEKGNEKGLRIGILGCVNGAGISYRYFKDKLGGGDYARMDRLAASVESTDGLFYIPYGNGPERTQQDKNTGAYLTGLDLNRHEPSHIYRAITEGVVYAMTVAIDVMKELGMPLTSVKAGNANMFKSALFRQLFVDINDVPLEFYEADGAAGAARGAAVGLEAYDLKNAFDGLEKKLDVEPSGKYNRNEYHKWQAMVRRTSAQ